MKKATMAIAGVLLLAGCGQAGDEPMPEGTVVPITAQPSPTSSGDPQGPPGPGILVLFADGQRVGDSSEDGRALASIKPEVRQRVEAIFAKRGSSIVASHEAGSDYLALQAPRGTAPAVLQTIIDDLRADPAVLAAEVDLPQAPAS